MYNVDAYSFESAQAFINKSSNIQKMFIMISPLSLACPVEDIHGHFGNNILILVEFYFVKL